MKVSLTKKHKLDYSAENYDWQEFRLLVIAIFSRIPCPLCGEIHAVRMHAYLVRKIRNNETWENEQITVLSIFCARARKKGDQYTKRILPGFVTPECNIMLWNVMKYVARHPGERINYAKAQMILGAKDRRTIGKHILSGRQIMEETNLELTQTLSGMPSFAYLPEQKPGVGIHERLTSTVDEIDRAVRRMHGAGREKVPAIGYVHVAYAFDRARNPVKISGNSSKTPLNRVLSILAFHDTS